jgi:hypothetical protein
VKITVITRSDGGIVGTTRSAPHAEGQGPDGMRGRIVPMPGQRLHEIDVPAEVLAIEDQDELHRRISTYLPSLG